MNEPLTSNLGVCPACKGPIGTGSNHEYDRCLEVQVALRNAEIERLTRECADKEAAVVRKALLVMDRGAPPIYDTRTGKELKL